MEGIRIGDGSMSHRKTVAAEKKRVYFEGCSNVEGKRGMPRSEWEAFLGQVIPELKSFGIAVEMEPGVPYPLPNNK
ncbi:hypothetical protein C4559_06505 [Candidatus Microgenomates bacterium]|nr:MAG: hypothetical protein C4559_06505 [Candidatus Microgenomates bacterium]